jgi:transposase
VHIVGGRVGSGRVVQLAIHGHRGMKGDPLYSARRTLHTGAGLLTDKQADRLTAMFAVEEHVEVEATWGIYQRMIAAYRHEDRRHGHELMVKLIDSISSSVPRALTEVITLGRTLKKRAADVLAYFHRPGTSNGLTEAINGRLEHLRGSALGVPQPHRLHRPLAARDRRFQTPTTPWIGMSPQTATHCQNRISRLFA